MAARARKAPSLRTRGRLSSALQKRLTDLEMTQSELARRVGTARDNVSGWVRGDAFPRPDMLEKVASELGCEVADLLPPDLPEEPGEAPEFEFRYNRRTGRARVHLNMELPLATAEQILHLLRALEEEEREEPGSAAD